jgi:hypothetical protein
MAVSLGLALLAGLIAGLGQLTGLAGDLTQPSPAERALESASAVAALPESLPGALSDIVEPIANDVSTALSNLAHALQSVEPPLGHRVSQVLRALGAWVSTPFSLLANLLVFALPIALVARWLGGSGTLRNQMSLLLRPSASGADRAEPSPSRAPAALTDLGCWRC